jgi:hypothetical protein
MLTIPIMCNQDRYGSKIRLPDAEYTENNVFTKQMCFI